MKRRIKQDVLPCVFVLVFVLILGASYFHASNNQSWKITGALMVIAGAAIAHFWENRE